MKLTAVQQLASKFFNIKELVCPHVYERFGDEAWSFLDERLLNTLYTIRLYLDKPIIVNNWAKGGSYSQRGLRCNVCPLVKEKTSLEKVYVTAHLQGKAIDFHVPGLTSDEVRDFIVGIQRQLPYPIRIERGTQGWVHIDMRASEFYDKINFFNP